MAEINPTYKDRVRYRLEHEQMHSLTITDPIGWNDDDKEWSRVNDYKGIVAKFSNSLKFVEDAAEYITLVLELYGPNAKIRCTKEVSDHKTDVLKLSYYGYLDLLTYLYEDGDVSVKMNSSGIVETLKSREDEKIEIEREETLDGSPMDPIETDVLELPGRRIFLYSEGSIDSTNNSIDVTVASNVGDTVNKVGGIPLKIDINSHEGILKTVTPQITTQEDVGDLGMMFLYDMDRDRTFDIDINFDFDVFFQQYENVQWCFYKVCLTVYENGFNFNVKNRIVLDELNSGFDPSNPQSLPANFDLPLPQFTKNVNGSYSNSNFTLLQGESASFEVYLKADLFDDNNAGVRAYARNITDVDFSLEEDSIFESSTTKVMLAHKLLDRILHTILDRKKILHSRALGTVDLGYEKEGFAALTGFAHGMWIRKFDRYPENEDNKYIKLSTSFKEIVDFLKTAWGLDVGIETNGYHERIVIEDERYFFNNNVLIRLPNVVSKIKRTVAKEYLNTNIQIGYAKAGEYEEAMGLDEFNTTSTFITAIKVGKQQFNMVCTVRPDAYGVEFTRRKPKDSFPTTDTKQDSTIFAFDMKRFYNTFKVRKWQDDFEEEPQNVFSPETAYNLRWSPKNSLFYRHGWKLAAGLLSYPMDYLRFGTSTANSKLITKLIGMGALQEDEPVLNSTLERARFKPEWVEFQHEVSQELLQQIEGKTNILGREIPNFYGLVEYRINESTFERGFLFNLKPNKEGNWKILRATR